MYSVALTVPLESLSRAQRAWEVYACLQNHSFCPSFLPFPFFICILLITFWILRLLYTAHQTRSICQRSLWLLQFVQLQTDPVVQTRIQLLMWCGKASTMRPFLVSTPQEQQVSQRPLGCFHKWKKLLLQSGVPLWLGTFLRSLQLPQSSLLQCATEIALAGRTCCPCLACCWNSRQTLAVLKISLQMSETLCLGRVLQFEKVNVVSSISFSRKLGSDFFLHLPSQILCRAVVMART